MQRLDDRSLGRTVDLAHEVLRTLGGNRQQVEIARATRDDVAGAACGLDGRGQHRVHESGVRGQVTEDRRSVAPLRHAVASSAVAPPCETSNARVRMRDPPFYRARVRSVPARPTLPATRPTVNRRHTTAKRVCARARRSRADEPAGEHRRCGARDAHDGARPTRCSWRRRAFRMRTRRRWRQARPPCSNGARVVPTLDGGARRERGCRSGFRRVRASSPVA